MRCVLEPGDAIVDCPPTFTMYCFDADVNDARVITVPRLEGFRVDVEAIKWVVGGEGKEVGREEGYGYYGKACGLGTCGS